METRVTQCSSPGARPALGIVGFGAFGRLIARHLHARFRLYVFDPAPPDVSCHEVRHVTVADLPTVAGCGIVVLAVPVDQFAAAIATIRPHLRPGTLVLDVGSVKVGPCAVMRRDLPDDVEILGTHPLFGPQSARNGIRGLGIALCPIRGRSAMRVAAFLRAGLGLKVVLTTPEAHDRQATVAQGLTHRIAAVLLRMEPLPSRMTTASFEMLMRAVEMVRHDAPSVFNAIGQANPLHGGGTRAFLRLGGRAAGLPRRRRRIDPSAPSPAAPNPARRGADDRSRRDRALAPGAARPPAARRRDRGRRHRGDGRGLRRARL
jgi:prephenate dehydrogenase